MKKILIGIFILLFFGCGNKSVNIDQDFSSNFEKAMSFFNKEKFSRARDEFDYIIKSDSGSKLANEAQFYKGECLFEIKEYDEAWVSYDRYIRFSNDFDKIEKSRYRICECAISSSNSYQRDQKQTKRALEQLQMFIEDFPKSIFIEHAERSITELRYKLAKKEYEVARLYLKLEEYESAIIYFRSVLNNYYDTDFADEARIGIIFTHILNDNRNGARRYLETEKDRFLQSEKYETAVSLFEETESGLKLHHYYQLYK
ncbi:MAG: outer membrane protein assembly factor BamD [Candidatus Neomarinimicrobiota bacterium]|nr:outer membrane protein assembly factor BamD [Candidatus Neomarinimicrobiota bacterium]